MSGSGDRQDWRDKAVSALYLQAFPLHRIGDLHAA